MTDTDIKSSILICKHVEQNIIASENDIATVCINLYIYTKLKRMNTFF